MDSSADLISELPDALLLHIYSFLDATAVIQSSVLSRRWRYLWTLIPFPERTKQMRSYFKEQKMEIHEEKLRLEEDARNTVSGVFIDIAKAIGQYSLLSLLFAAKASDLILYGISHFIFTVMIMKIIYFYSNSRLGWSDKDMKRLQERDSRLTSAANSYSTGKPMMEAPVS